MQQPHSVSNREQVADTMIDLTRLSHLHRAIVTGRDRMELYLALWRRGFIRVATTATCRIPRGQHVVGLVTGQDSPAAIEAVAITPSRNPSIICRPPISARTTGSTSRSPR